MVYSFNHYFFLGGGRGVTDKKNKHLTKFVLKSMSDFHCMPQTLLSLFKENWASKHFCIRIWSKGSLYSASYGPKYSRWARQYANVPFLMPIIK